MSVRRLPIFPLSIVLFPGTPQFLHIFEPRYRRLLADCRADDATFGISFVGTATGDDAVPPPGHAGCCAIVRGARRLPDGRSNILTVGGDRYVLRDYVDAGTPYLIARVETFDDDETESPPLEELADRVRRRFLRFLKGIHALSDQTGDLPALTADPKALSFEVSAGIDLDPRIKQQLLVLRSTEQRLRRLDAVLGRLNGEIERRAAVHRRARRNGRGHGDRRPDIARES